MEEERTPGRRDPAQGGAEDSRARRRAGLHALAKTLPKITKRALGVRGFAEAGLLGDWPNIVGKEIAARCLPRKLERPRPGRRGEAVLTLRVEAGCAIELQHLEPVLIERINGYFGYRAVGRLRLLQAPMPPSRSPQEPPPRPLGPGAESALRGRLGLVEDPELRAALERLGRAVLRPRD
jgi:hypothetical protein